MYIRPTSNAIYDNYKKQSSVQTPNSPRKGKTNRFTQMNCTKACSESKVLPSGNAETLNSMQVDAQ